MNTTVIILVVWIAAAIVLTAVMAVVAHRYPPD